MPFQIHFMRRVKLLDGWRVIELPVGQIDHGHRLGFFAANKHRDPIQYDDPLGWDYIHAKDGADVINARLDEIAPRSLDRGSAFACYVNK